MSYCETSDLYALLSAQQVIDAADDDRDGQADDSVLTAVLAAGSEEVDRYIEGRYDVPVEAADFASGAIPALVKRASVLFSIGVLYARRGVKEKDTPFASLIADIRKALEAVRDGKENLGQLAAVSSPGYAITEDLQTEGSMQ